MKLIRSNIDMLRNRPELRQPLHFAHGMYGRSIVQAWPSAISGNTTSLCLAQLTETDDRTECMETVRRAIADAEQ